MTGRVAALYRHPVKGFTPQAVDEVLLAAGGHFPCDRLYAVEDGPSGFDPAAPAHLSKQKFTVLAKLAGIAKVRTAYDETTGLFQASAPGHPPLQARLTEPRGRAALAEWLTGYLGEQASGPLKVLAAPGGHRFMDSRNGFVSLLNLDSLGDLERRLGRPVDPLRFRANIHVRGWPAWSEFDVVGRTLKLGEAELEGLSAIDRCAATHVNPQTGERDLDMVPALRAELGHIDCGIYARVTGGGRVRAGDAAIKVAA
jgi:uncharacterized protein YcbX